MRVGKRLGRAGLILGGLVTGLLLAECGLRLTGPGGGEFLLEARIGSIPADLYQPDPDLKTVLRPGVKVIHQSIEYRAEIRTNSLGIRGPEPLPKNPDEIRILSIGDSFTLGIQVDEDETASSQLASSLSSVWERPVTAWNAGVDGYGTDQATQLARRLAPQIQPDIILLRFYLGNDLRDNSLWSRSSSAPPPVAAQGSESEHWSTFHRRVARFSRLYARLLTWSTIRNSASDPRIQEMGDEVRPFVDPDVLLGLLPATQGALVRTAALCRELSIPCVVSWIPPAHAVHSKRAPATFEVFGLEADQSNPQGLQSTVASVLPRDLLSCNPGAALREASNEELYFIFDPHWTAEGHRVAAQAESSCIQMLIDPDSL